MSTSQHKYNPVSASDDHAHIEARQSVDGDEPQRREADLQRVVSVCESPKSHATTSVRAVSPVDDTGIVSSSVPGEGLKAHQKAALMTEPPARADLPSKPTVGWKTPLLLVLFYLIGTSICDSLLRCHILRDQSRPRLWIACGHDALS